MKKKADSKLFDIASFHFCTTFAFLASKETDLEKKLKEEEKILQSVAGRTGKYILTFLIDYRIISFSISALMAAVELAKGIEYKDAIKTG